MANEFVARKGLISSGSINVSGSVTASFFKGDGSQLTNIAAIAAVSGTLNIDTYTFVGNGTTTNYVLSQSYNANSLFLSVDGLTQTNIEDYTVTTNTVSFVTAPPSQSNILVRALVNVTQNATGSFSGSFFGIIESASYAQTASYALNAQSGGSGAGFPFSGSAVITGSLQVVPTGSVGGITGSVSGALTGTFPYSGLTGTPTLVSASSQIDYNNLVNKLSGVVSSSVQVQPLLPGGTVSSSAQVISLLASQNIAPSSVTATSISGSSITITGTATVQTLVETSTQELKKNIIPLESTLNTINQLSPSRFEWKENDEQDIGLIAEQVQEIYPELVKYDTEGNIIGVKYSKLTVLLLKAIQEMTEKIQILEQK
jgi:hypothetical protein